jgi:BMFP domain-containing protein YqiC
MPVFAHLRKHLKAADEITSYDATEEAFMPATNSRFFDELAKLMTNAAGAAQGVRKEVDTLVQAQVERVLNNLNVVKREDFDVVKDMAEKARSENMKLEARLAELEKKLNTQ